MLKFIITLLIAIPALIPTISYTYTYSMLMRKHNSKEYSINVLSEPKENDITEENTILYFETIQVTETKYSLKGIPFLTYILKNSKKYSLRPVLVASIIKQESRFNHEAVSYMNAIGLMQIVPHKAGQDMNRIIFKDNNPISEDLLFDPAFNIRIGCAYLNFLDKTYLNGIENNISKEYCMIAGYNTGIGNVIKALLTKQDIEEIESLEGYNDFKNYQKFLIKKNIAIDKINNMTDSELKDLLVERLPYEETVTYLNNIIVFMDDFKIDDFEIQVAMN